MSAFIQLCPTFQNAGGERPAILKIVKEETWGRSWRSTY